MSAAGLPFNPEHLFMILVRPQHPGNIGPSCRALKNMGLKKLRLVDPPNFDRERARWMAPGAEDILEKVEIFATLDEALADLSTVVGTTCRPRHWRFPMLSPRLLPGYLLPRARENRVGILFGQEDFGLDNDAISRCEMLVEIPTVDLKSLNLSQAVLILAYELSLARYPEQETDGRKLAEMSERERLVGAVMTLAERVDFLKNRNPEQAASLMRGLTGRLGMESHEVGALLGFVRRTLWHLDQKSARAGNDPTALLEPTPLEGESTE